MIVLVICALLLGLSVPSMAAWLARHRLRATAEQLVADLAEARLEAARTQRAVHVSFQPGDEWCYGLSFDAGADCRHADARLLKRVGSADRPGVRLLAAAPMHIDVPGRTTLPGLGQGQAQFATARLELVTVRLSAMGRPGLCAVDGQLPALRPC